MNIRFFVMICSTFVTCVACSEEKEQTKFESLKIPNEYVIQAPSDGPTGIYDDQDISILLGISDVEIQKSIPHWEIANVGNKEQSFIIHRSLMDLFNLVRVLAPSALENPQKFVADSYLEGTSRLVLTYNRWLLVSEEGNQNEFRALCRSGVGIDRKYDVCDFKTNIDGFGVGYSLKNENISLAREFEEYIFQKINEWKVVD
jgi:hypothetical protein